MKVGVDLYDSGNNFLPLACPHCGSVENLDLTVEGYWDCDKCGRGFIITFARVITVDDPPFARVVFDLPDSEAANPK